MSNLFILLKNSFINSTGINSLSNRTSNSKEKKKLSRYIIPEFKQLFKVT